MRSKTLRRISQIGLLSLIAATLVLNARYLYTTPVPNTWIWWAGDETWLMTKSILQITTGHYLYPNAYGSILSHESGFLVGTAWLSSIIYGLPAALIAKNSIDVGRTVTLILGVLTLCMVYFASRRAGVNKALAAVGVVMLATTTCFFITSHSARYDMLVGLSNLAVISASIGIIGQRLRIDDGIRFGILLLCCLLINLHVVLDLALPLAFIFWRKKLWHDSRSMISMIYIVTIGLSILYVFHYLLSGTPSIIDASDPANTVTFRFFSPGAQKGNLLYRYFIMSEWAPMYFWLLVPSVAGYALYFKKNRQSITSSNETFLLLGALGLLLFANVYFEAILPRYLIYVLPLLTVVLVIGIQKIMDFTRGFARNLFAVGIASMVAASFSGYLNFAMQMGEAGTKMYKSNMGAVDRAASFIQSPHSSAPIKVIATDPSLYALADCKDIVPIVPHFFYTPDTARPLLDFVNGSGADYILIFNSSRVPRMGKDTLWGKLLAEHASQIFEEAGVLTDIGRSYSPGDTIGLDTLLLYKLRR
jgi:hypothetical protein